MEATMMPIPKKYKKNGIAAYNTIPEAERFAEELTKETGVEHVVTVDNASGTAVVEMCKASFTDEDTDINNVFVDGTGWLPEFDLTVEGIKACGNGDLVRAFRYCKKTRKDHDSDAFRDEIIGLIHEEEKKTEKKLYAIVYVGDENTLVVLKTSDVYQTADGEEIKIGMEVYSTDNEMHRISGISYFREPVVTYGHDIFMIVPAFTVDDGDFIIQKNGLGRIRWDRYQDSSYIDISDKERTTVKSTLWTKKEARQFAAKERRSIYHESKAFRMQFFKEEIMFKRIVAAIIAGLALGVTILVGSIAYANSYAAERNVTVSITNSDIKCQTLGGDDAYSYTLTTADGATAVFATPTEIQIPSDGQIEVTIKTKHNGKANVFYGNEQLTRIK